MTLLKIIINLTIGYFLLKLVTLLWSVISFKINYKRHFKIKTKGLLNDVNYKGKVLLCVLLDHQTNDIKRIVQQYEDILLGYKNVHVAFITNEQEDIEIAMKHNDEQSTREIINDYIDGMNEKLERRDAVMLIHYPYDNDNKAQMIDFAVKEFLLKYETIEKISSYIGIFDGSSVLEEAFIPRLEKTFTKYKYPELIETINIRMNHVNRINKLNNYLAYLFNADRTIKAMNRTVARTNFKKLFHLNRFLPYYCDFKGTLIRLDTFYEEDMLSGTTNYMDTIVANYYFKHARRETMYVENDVDVVSDPKKIEENLERHYLLWHSMKKQATAIAKYRYQNKFKKFMFKSYYNSRMIYNSIGPYIIFFALVCLLVTKNITLPVLLSFIGSMYLYALAYVITYREKSKWYDNDNYPKEKFFIRLVSFLMYPLFLVYRCNGFIDYILKDTIFKKQNDKENEIKNQNKPKKVYMQNDVDMIHDDFEIKKEEKENNEVKDDKEIVAEEVTKESDDKEVEIVTPKNIDFNDISNL